MTDVREQVMKVEPAPEDPVMEAPAPAGGAVGVIENERYFRTEHLQSDLSGRTLRGGAVTMTGQGARFILNLASTALLARLLVPQDFGLVAMVAAITGFL